MRFRGFIGPSYTLRSVNVDCQRCVNLFPEIDEMKTGKEQEVAALLSTPGLLLLATIGSGPIRCSYRGTNDVLYVVSGNTLYSVSNTWAGTSLGTLATSNGAVSMVDDGFNLVIVDGPNGYDYNLKGLTFTNITGVTGFLGATQVTFQDGYFMFNQPKTNHWYLADLPTGTATANIAFTNGTEASKEGFSDNIVGIISANQTVLLLGERTGEFWYDSGASDFPFQKIQGGFMEQGLAAAFSLTQINGTFFWLGANDTGQGIVFMNNGYTAQRISTHAVELAIQNYAIISDATAYTYQDGGHTFYVLNFSSAQATWVYDLATGMWHERGFLSGGVLKRHLADNHAYVYNTHVVGDYSNGNLYAFSNTVYTDNGAPILRLRTSPHITADLDRIAYHYFQLDMESGTGSDGLGQGVNPQAMLRYSNDGGHTWSFEKWANIGAIGLNKAQVKWRRLGIARDRVFSISITDPIKVTLIGAKLEMEKAAS